MIRKLLLIGAALAISLCAQIVEAAPTIFHSSETAEPGDVIGIQGDSFGSSPQVWIQHVWSNTATLSPATQIATVNASATFVSAQIPVWETPGLYAVWVYNGSSYSAPVFINRARSWGTVDLAGSQIDPSRFFRLYGRNLCLLPNVTPTVRFVNGSTSLYATVSVSGSDEYVLNVTAPAGLSAGVAYDVYVSNGLGGTYGETKATTLTARAGGSDPFGLGVPWGADFTFSGNIYNVKNDSRLALHATGNGVTDDTAAIQAAINAANAAGGGVVYFPAGTYMLSIGTANTYSALTLKSNVVLKGDGMDQSHLVTTGWDPDVYSSANINCWGTLTRVGFADIDVNNTATGGGIAVRIDAGTSKVFIIRSRIQSQVGKSIMLRSSSQLLVRDSEMINYQTDPTPAGLHGDSLYSTDNTDVIIKDNDVLYHTGRFSFSCSVRQLVEGNHLIRDTNIGTYTGNSGGFYPSASSNTVILDNILEKSGSGQYPNLNDGESILDENVNTDQNRIVGTVSSATSTTLTDSSKSWAANLYGTPFTSAADQLESIAIVSGPGAGQIRKVIASTANSITVDRAWDVIPTASSKYSLHIIGEHNMIKDNSITQQTRGIWIYSSAQTDLIIVGNTLTDAQGIWLRTDYRPTETNTRFETQSDCYIADNTVSNTLGWYPVIIGSMHCMVGTGTPTFGTAHYGVEYRHNTLSTLTPNLVTGVSGEGYMAVAIPNNGSLASTDNTGVSLLGVIFQGNTAINTNDAFHLTTGDYYTVLWGNVAQNATNTVLDVQGTGTTHASIGTVNVSGVANKFLNSAFENDTPNATPLSTLGTVPTSWTVGGRVAVGSGVRQVCAVAGGSPFDDSDQSAAFVDSTASTSGSRLDWQQSITALGADKAVVYSFDVQVNNINGTVGNPDIYHRVFTSGNTALMNLRINKNGTNAVLSSNVGGVATQLATLTTGAWYRIICVIPAPNSSGSHGVKVYVTPWGGQTTLVGTIDGASSTTGISRAYINLSNPGNAVNLRYDNVSLETSDPAIVP